VSDLTADAKRFAVAGLGAGATLAEIEERLGPPDSWLERRRGRLVYPRLGLHLGLDAEKLTQIEVTPDTALWWRGGEPSPYRGRWLPWGTDEPPDEKKLIELHGQPKTRESDEDGLSLEWQVGEVYLGADFTLAGKLQCFWVDMRE
jgi:hypothetical protein